MKNFKFRMYHCTLQLMMDKIAKIRFRLLKPGSEWDLKLAEWYASLLNKQMAAREKAGVKEIECHVTWSAW